MGMTRIFDDTGNMIPVTAVKAQPLKVIAIKTAEKDGYKAVCVGFGDIRKKLVRKPQAGQYKNVDSEPNRYIREIKIGSDEEFKVGDTISVDTFAAGENAV